MKKLSTPVICIFALSILISCASEMSYSQRIASRPMPLSQQDKVNECGWIRSEITRMNNIGRIGASRGVMWAEIAAQKNIADLENRAAAIGCSAAFSTTTVVEKTSASIDDCIKACKENTRRSPEECFDACNRK